MSRNTERFTGRAAEYAQYRERYDPQVVLPLLRELCGLAPEWLIADVGAGTGMLSDVFLENGNRVIAVEPNAEMRAACTRLHRGNKLLRVVDGTAEATGLGDASADAVSAGRAFHWFSIEPAITEFQRLLKPGGWIFVIAAGRSEAGRKENERLRELLRSSVPPEDDARARYGVYKRLDEIFSGWELHHAESAGEMTLDWQALRGLVLSLSHVPLANTARFADFEKALREYFAQFENNGKITLSTRYWINAVRRSPDRPPC